MTDYIEFEGKTIEKALENASRSLDKDMEDIRYDVVSHGSTGIFGLVGVKKAKIRVEVEGEKAKVSSDIQSEAKERARDLVNDTFQLEEKPVASEHYQRAAETGKGVLQRLIDFISEGADIRSEIQRDRILLNVSGGNSGLLIGKRGQTLEAMQYLVEKIVNKQSDQRVRLLVDVEGYLETRKDNLKKLASRMAEKAKKINKPVTIGQMNAYDRRIVHLHLKDNSAVRTQSVGEGYYRKLVIFPKKRRKHKNNQKRTK
jgi:spoIIIJ-associated protein